MYDIHDLCKMNMLLILSDMIQKLKVVIVISPCLFLPTCTCILEKNP